MELLTQNGKMKKSSKDGITVVNWTIPAFSTRDGFKTCPNAGLCAVGCYARQGTYMFGNVRNAHETKLEFSKSNSFTTGMKLEIVNWLAKRNVKHLKVRIHDAGDFYSIGYLNKWLSIIEAFKDDTRVSFYAYTKQVEMFQNEAARIPSNFTVIFSYGGKQDAKIDVNRDRHARVFESIDALMRAGYVDGTHDDMVAAIGPSIKIGLCYHGAKSYNNTKWAKVA